jgi:hypothetical protein
VTSPSQHAQNPLSRRHVLLGTAAATAAGWTWQAGSASAATASAVPKNSVASTSKSAGPGGLLDYIVLGDPASESAHDFSVDYSAVISGGLGQAARTLGPNTSLPTTDEDAYWGGTASFELKVDPKQTTYVTIKLWGGDYDDTTWQTDGGTESWRLQLFAGGDVVGYLDQGEIDCLDMEDTAPRAPGRFFYHTIFIPEAVTAGKTSLTLQVRSMGGQFAYAQNAETFYTAQTTPSRGIYRLYTHTDPYFQPPKGDIQGPAPKPNTRTSPGAEVMTTITARVQADQLTYFETGDPTTFDPWAYEQLAEGYLWSGGPAYQQSAALERVCQAIDAQYMAWLSDPTQLTGSGQQWQGFGRAGLVLALLWPDIEPNLALNVTGDPYEIANPGFENGSGTTAFGWSVEGWVAGGTAQRTDAYAHSGTYSMQLVRGTGAAAIAVSNNAKVSLSQGSYTYGVWVKGDGLTGNGVFLDVLFYDGDGNIVGTDNKVYSPDGTFDWTYLSQTLTTPSTAISAWLFIGVQDGGTAYIDDVTLVAPSTSTYSVPTRVAAYTKMLQGSRDYWRETFPHYSNQSQICATGIYQANRGLSLIAPSLALPEKTAREYLYQSIGLKPWLGPENPLGTPTEPLGKNYLQISPKGISREIGYVGNYGETQGWLTMMYESVVRGYQPAKAPEIYDRLVQVGKTRGYFRYVDVDAEGNRIAYLESVVGWRNETYPGALCYAHRTDWDANPVEFAAAFPDPEIVGWAQEQLADGQFYNALTLLTTSQIYTRVGLNAFRLVSRDWPAFQKLPKSPSRLPADWDGPDYVFTDEISGVVALKHGQELLFASLYFRARQAVNDIARFHHLTPVTQRSASIREQSMVTASGEYPVPDWICWDYAIDDPSAVGVIPGGGFLPPGPALTQSLSGENWPIAKQPADVTSPSVGVNEFGVESVLVGKASYYQVAYGPYLIAMNTSDNQHFTFHTEGEGTAKNLTDGGRTVRLGESIGVPPQSTVILYQN